MSAFKKLVKSTLSDVVGAWNKRGEEDGTSKCKVERIKKEAYHALKESTEGKLTELFRFANERAVLNDRQTVTVKKDFNPEVTRAFAPHIYAESQATERSARGLKNVTEYNNPIYTNELDYMYIIGRKKERSKTNKAAVEEVQVLTEAPSEQAPTDSDSD